MTEHIVVYQISMKNGGTSSAWIDTDEVTYNSAKLYDEYKCRVLYTSQQPAQQPLTDEQIKAIHDECDAPTGHEFVFAFARAIEAKLKEKNT